MELFDLHGRVAVVTGGGTGIGAATARLLAAQGADVAIAARTAHDLERTAAGIEADTGKRCLVVTTDVKDEAQVVALIRRSVEELGRLDILVNNAGGTRLGPLQGLPTKAWDAQHDLHAGPTCCSCDDVIVGQDVSPSLVELAGPRRRCPGELRPTSIVTTDGTT
jgi:NAD(P)-dependent dehydrogenase (short-subunit alcohol dehydrogenase family)